MSNRPILTILNNGIIDASMAMPMKDLTSDGDSNFEMNRRLFNRSYVAPTDFSQPQVGTTIVQRHALGLSNNTVVIDGAKTAIQKKWIGGNRDASQVTKNRRVNTSGSTMVTTGPTSFKNVSDNNTTREAIIRVRSGGYRVPPKVTQKYLSVTPVVDTNTYYRIVSKGLNASYSVTSGVYSYTSNNLSGTNVMTGLRSYNLVTISKTTGQIVSQSIYDVFGSINNANIMAGVLNDLDDSVIAIVYTFDEPETNINTALTNAMIRCGASSAVFSSTTILYRSAYILVGVPGSGDGQSIYEKYAGRTTNTFTSDINAWIDLRISIDTDGNCSVVSSTSGYDV